MRGISNGIWLAIFVIEIFFAIKCAAISGLVTINCVHDVDLVKITYVGDAQGVLAVNKKDTSCFFDENMATASYELLVGMNNRPNLPCQMDKKGVMDIYTITVQGRLLHRDFEDMDDEEFLIQCNFQPVVTDVRYSAAVVDIGHQPNILRQNKAPLTKSTFALSFVKIDGTEFKGSVTMGRKLRIKVTMKAANKDAGFKPLSCKATSGDGKKTLVMMADGCGTGKPWDYDYGFDIKGMTALSPTFKLFRLIRRQSVVFTCDFVICSTACDGNSCHRHGRKRRGIGIFHNQTTTLTAAITIPPRTEVTRKRDLAATEDVDQHDIKHPCRQSENGETCDQTAANNSQYRLSSEKGVSYLVKMHNGNSGEVADKPETLPVEVQNLIRAERSQQKKAAIVVDSDHVHAKTALKLDLAGVNLRGSEGIPEADEIKSDQSQIENAQPVLKNNDTHQLWKKTKSFFKNMMHVTGHLLTKAQTFANGNLQTKTSANGNLKTKTSAIRNLQTKTSANGNLQTKTSANGKLKTKTSAIRNLQTKPSANGNLQTKTSANGNLQTIEKTTFVNENLQTTSANDNLQITIAPSVDDDLKTTESEPIPVKVVEDEGIPLTEVGFILLWALPVLFTIGFFIYACLKTVLYFKQVKLDRLGSTLKG